MRSLVCVIPSRTDDYLDALFRSLERSEAGSVAHCVVSDNGLSPGVRSKWPQAQYVDAGHPFVFARAINRGVARARVRDPGSDLLLLNDDTEIATDHWHGDLKRLLAHPRSHPFGIIAPMVHGGVGNAGQRYRDLDGRVIVESRAVVCFVAVAVRAEAWSDVGALDERFAGYGFDDDDYCARLWRAGWLAGVTNVVRVNHGRDGRDRSSTYERDNGKARLSAMYHTNRTLFYSKWGGAARPPRRCLFIGDGEIPTVLQPHDKWMTRVSPVADAGRFDNVILDHSAMSGHSMPDTVTYLTSVLEPGGTATLILGELDVPSAMLAMAGLGCGSSPAPLMLRATAPHLGSDGNVNVALQVEKGGDSSPRIVRLDDSAE